MRVCYIKQLLLTCDVFLKIDGRNIKSFHIKGVRLILHDFPCSDNYFQMQISDRFIIPMQILVRGLLPTPEYRSELVALYLNLNCKFTVPIKEKL